ncbi:MAG: ATP-binding protein, partial [Eubacterium sp.]
MEEDLIENIRLYHVTEMVYRSQESTVDKFTTVFNTISAYNASVFLVMDSDGLKTDFYIGVRNNETDDNEKRSSVTLSESLRSTLAGQFPGIKLNQEDRKTIGRLSEHIAAQKNTAAVSVVGSMKNEKIDSEQKFVQGMEKLTLAMQGKKYIGIIIAQNQPASAVQMIRNNYEELYTKLSALQKDQMTYSSSEGTSRAKSFSEMSGKQKAAALGSAAVSMAGVVGG